MLNFLNLNTCFANQVHTNVNDLKSCYELLKATQSIGRDRYASIVEKITRDVLNSDPLCSFSHDIYCMIARHKYYRFNSTEFVNSHKERLEEINLLGESNRILYETRLSNIYYPLQNQIKPTGAYSSGYIQHVDLMCQSICTALESAASLGLFFNVNKNCIYILS